MTVLLIVLLKPFAFSFSLIDKPDQRKTHIGSIPLIGGLAIYGGFLTSLIFIPDDFKNYLPLFSATLILLLVGVYDDLHNINAKVRLFFQLIAVFLLATWGDAKLVNLGNLFFFGDLTLVTLALPITLFAGMSLINAINMIDGLDGLAGGLTFLSFLSMAILCALKTDWINFYILSILCACLVAFLCFNWRFFQRKPAQLFLGDGGSLLLGILLVWFTIKLTQGEFPVARPVTMLWLIALPLMDLLTVFIRRFSQGRPLMKASREHLHHLLQQKGFTANQTLCYMCGFSLFCITIGLIGEWKHINESGMFIGYLLLFIGYYQLNVYLRDSQQADALT